MTTQKQPRRLTQDECYCIAIVSGFGSFAALYLWWVAAFGYPFVYLSVAVIAAGQVAYYFVKGRREGGGT